MKVLICDSMPKVSIEILKNEGFEVDEKTGLKEDEIVSIIGSYSAVIVGSATKISANIINAASALKFIGRAGSGVDTIDVPAANSKGIKVMNVPGGNTLAVVELAIGLMLSMVRFIPQSCKDLKSGLWEKKKYMGSELYKKTLGIIGFGKIGLEVARRCKAFDMRVIAYVRREKPNDLGIEFVDFETLLKESDFISLHLPGGPSTKNLLSDKELSLCKDKVFIVNCARGGIINEADALKHLNSGKIAGLATDVFSKEPPEANDPLVSHPNVIVTPHLGASTKEAQQRVGVSIAQQIADALKGKAIVGAVN
jgi:D-3-phosphoglycerate dehydrogenase